MPRSATFNIARERTHVDETFGYMLIYTVCTETKSSAESASSQKGHCLVSAISFLISIQRPGQWQ